MATRLESVSEFFRDTFSLATFDKVAEFSVNYSSSFPNVIDLVPDVIDLVPVETETDDIDGVLVVAALLASIVVFGICGPVLWVLFQPRSKNSPPLGPSIKAFVAAARKGEIAYSLLDNFRNQVNGCGVFEYQTNAVDRLLLGGRFFAISDDRTARAILEDSLSTKWDKGYKFFVDMCSGMNVVSEPLNGFRWKHVRKATAQAFSSANMRFMEDHIDIILREWIENKLKPSVESGEALDILAETNFLTSQIITKAAFDYVLHDNECKQVLECLNTCYVEFGSRSTGNIFRELEMTRWMYKGIRDGRQAANYLFEFCTKMLMSYRVKTEKKPHMIIDMIDNDESYADDHERVCDMVAYIVAGFDTTANTLAFCLKELALNKDEQDKLRSELKACGTKQEARYCPALKNVVRETLRLHPAASSGSLRIVGQDIPVVGSPYVIPKNSLCIMPYYAIQRNASVYENPDEFQPGRWMDASDRMMQCFMPFAAGRRGCQGQALANAEMDTIISQLLSEFEFRIVEEGTTQCPVLHEPVGLKLSAHYVEDSKQQEESTQIERGGAPLGLDVLVLPFLGLFKGSQ